MADFSALKTAIQTYIKQNGNEEITGEILQEILLSVVTTLGDSAINDLITALANEVAARQNADGTLQTNITNEATARGNADTALGGRIDDEATARQQADNTLQGLINGIKGNIDNGYVYAGIATPSSTPATGKVFYLALTAGTYTNFGSTVVSQGINILKYNGSAWSLDAFIGIDDEPTPNSPKLVKSGGVADSISQLQQETQTEFQKLSLVRSKYAIQTEEWYGDEYDHFIIPVNGGETMNFTSTNGLLYVAYLTEYTTPVTGDTPSFVAGYFGRQLVTNGVFTIPEGTKYLVVNYPDLMGLTTMSIDGVNIYNGVYQSILGTITLLSSLSEQSLKQSDLTIEVISNNIANKDNIGGGMVDNLGAVSFAPISPSDTWRVLKVMLSPSDEGKKITFGGFYLGRIGYAAFYNGDTLVGSVITFYDPNGSQIPTTVTVPSGCDRLYIDILSGDSPYSLDANYTYLMVNYGDTLLSYDQFKEEVSQIKGYDIKGSGDGENVEDIIADLPVSDGSGISAGYAYIDSTTYVVKVKPAN